MVDSSVFGEYEAVAASQAAQVLGNSGAKGDYLDQVIVIPASVAPGAVTVTDGSTNIVVTTAGTATVLPGVFSIPIRSYAVTGPWKITTGANVSVLALGAFT